MKRIEEAIQQQIVNHFWTLKQLNQFRIPCVLYSNRNENNVGGAKGISSGARFKRMGRLAGIPDLSLIYKDPLSATGAKIVFIEVKKPAAHKTKKGKDTKSKGMSEDQIDFYNKYIQPMNIPFEVCSSVNDFDNFIWFLKL